MNWTPPTWPPVPYSDANWPVTWLRFETEYPNSGRRSRLVAHSGVPYVGTFTLAQRPTEKELGIVAADYLKQLHTFLTNRGLDPGFSTTMIDALSPDQVNAFQWLPLWPAFGQAISPLAAKLASWNLSRLSDHDLPASVIMVAAEVYDDLSNGGSPDLISLRSGIRVPMTVKVDGNDYTVTIRSVTAEFPAGENDFLTELANRPGVPNRDLMLASVSGQVHQLTYSDKNLEMIADQASVKQNTLSVNDVQFHPDQATLWENKPWTFTVRATAQGKDLGRQPQPLSYELVSTFRYDTIDANPRLVAVEKCPLVTHVAPEGGAMVFKKTPPGWKADPAAEYVWTDRRPTRTDDILDGFRSLFQLANTTDVSLEQAGYRICVCPGYVHGDLGAPPGSTKVVQLPNNHELPARRNAFSAVSAYYNCHRYFGLLSRFGLDPDLFVVQTQKKMQVFYRYGIFPGPGKSGRTINAQVTMDCSTAGKPFIHMNLALAELSRWARPNPPSWAQPLGISTSGRWVGHEIGHYLLAARLGQLEFDFAHSAGDAIAAVMFDPGSALADPPGNGVAESYRGITYPFVFTTRRHDRIVTMGWSWYGSLNRSVIENPPLSCKETKGYLTEQILSTTLFRLYKMLGGDSLNPDGTADVYLRRRASRMALFLLFRGIAGFAQSPSRAEMLELGLEEADWLSQLPVPVQDDDAAVDSDLWTGGTTHKAVRWAFEAQGMFPPDRTVRHSAPGQAPAVDIFVTDRRPRRERTQAGRIVYGRGAYAPVSLDWSPNARWLTKLDNIKVGNRGDSDAGDVHLRIWIGSVATAATPGRWDLEAQVTWLAVALELDLGTIAAGQRIDLLGNNDVQNVLASAPPVANKLILVLLEASCPNDRANTDPAAQLPSAAANDSAGLPVTPRALTDLVANDNNLGLLVIR
ncbi:MAG: hypothetical protein ACWA49_02685 [Ruegeria sp.]